MKKTFEGRAADWMWPRIGPGGAVLFSVDGDRSKGVLWTLKQLLKAPKAKAI